MSTEERSKGFTVTDRRGHADEPAASAAPAPAASESLPAIDFATFIMSLASSTLFHLGELVEGEGAPRPNLPLAKQSIDILGVLQDKTRGNLTDEEAQLLEHLLYDLRLKFVEAKKRQG